MSRLLIMALVCAFAAPSAAKKPPKGKKRAAAKAQTAAEKQTAAKVLRFATMAPARGAYGKALTAWAQTVEAKSKGAVQIRWSFGTGGREQALVDKMLSGQLDGAAITSVGLSRVHNDLRALEMPGLFQSWGQFDRLRDGMSAELSEPLNGAGCEVLGWADLGLTRVMSKGGAVRVPGDLRDMSVFAWDQDIMASTTASVLGYTPHLGSISSLLAALESGAVNTIIAPAGMARATPWSGELDHINAQVVGVVVGALVVREASVSDLPGHLRKKLRATGKKAVKAFGKRARKQDALAYEALRRDMTVVEPSEAEKGAWRTRFAEIRHELGTRRVFPPSLIRQVETLAGVR